MKKLHLGCGPNNLEDWENLDLPEIDITRPLPYADDSVDFVFTEHVIEHVTPQQGWKFFAEARRVLKVGGVLRLAFPDPVRICRHYNKRYLEEFNPWTNRPPTIEGSLASIIEDWGHVAIWTVGAVLVCLSARGFAANEVCLGESNYPELVGLERHGAIINQVEAMYIQTSVVEGVKIA